MDPTEVLEGVDRNASPTDGNTADDGDTAVSMVLHNHDLLLDIMLRLDLHTSLVRSIFVCKRWSFVASDPFLLRWFRYIHPPRLLGFYVATRSNTTHMLLRPRFVPMPPAPESYQPPPPPESDQPPPQTESDQPSPPTESDEPPPPTESDQPPPPTESDQPPTPESEQPPPPESDQPTTPPPPEPDQPPPQELAAAVRMVQSYGGLDAYDEELTVISDLQNDTVLVSGFYGNRFAVEVHWPLSPHRGVVAIPVTPYDQLDGTAGTAAHFLLKVDQGSRDSLAFVWLSMGFLIKGKGEYSVKYKAHIYVLQEDGQWRFRSSAAAVLPKPKSNSRPLLVGSKIYLEHSTSIAALDLKTSSFSMIPLPEGMERYDYEAMILAPVYDDSAVFLIHLDEDLQLCIWLHLGRGGAPNWLLADVVSLPEMFETLGMTGWTDYGEPATLLQTTQTGDFLEFVFLKLGQCAFCFDTRHRVLRKVYEVTQEDQTLERIHPFMMTWPPKFPALKSDRPARNVS